MEMGSPLIFPKGEDVRSKCLWKKKSVWILWNEDIHLWPTKTRETMKSAKNIIQTPDMQSTGANARSSRTGENFDEC